MKTLEFLRLYQNGRRDFQGMNLRGANLAGQDLSGTDFSGSQIQGANFRRANLTGTKFIGARAGLQKRWFIFAGSLFLAVNFIYSFCSAYIGYLAYFFATKYRLEILINFLVIPFIFGWIFLYHNTFKKNRTGLVFVVESILVAFLAIGTINLDIPNDVNSSAILFNIVAVGLSFSLLSPARGTIIGTLYVVGTLPFLYSATSRNYPEMLWYFYIKIWMLIATLWLNALAYFIGFYVLDQESDKVWVRKAKNLLLALISRKGTSFYGANLRDADFTDADVKNTDFQRAILTDTRWKHTKNVKLARFDRSLSGK